MPKIEDGGPFFPCEVDNFLGTSDWAKRYPLAAADLTAIPIKIPGISLRQWYAGMALQGIIRRVEVEKLGTEPIHENVAASLAYKYADAMIQAGLEKEK